MEPFEALQQPSDQRDQVSSWTVNVSSLLDPRL